MKYQTFDDVLIVPKFTTISSRADVNTTSSFGGLTMSSPLFSANMDTVTEHEMCDAMRENGGYGVLHRFMSIEDNVKQYLKSPDSFVSIGVGDKELERAEALFAAGCSKFCIDVANGASIQTVNQYVNLRKLVKTNAHIMVGNFATSKSIRAFQFYGSPDSYKVGIGGGSMCTTRVVTGIGIPQLTAIQYCVDAEVGNIVADGGIRSSGDVCKALAAGAKAVMIGGMFAGTLETPGFIQEEIPPYGIMSSNYVTKKYKTYRGSASKESYEAQGKTASHRSAEGESTKVPYKGPVKDVIEQIMGGLRSSMTYVNANNLEEYTENCEFIEITSNGVLEGKAHGKN